MLPLNPDSWRHLRHAYGAASDIPTLLQEAESDQRPGHRPDSTWFRLWSALCHQHDTYSASYAAAPHLVAMAPAKLAQRMYDPLLLVAMIELSRLEGRGPVVPEALSSEYAAALAKAAELIAHALPEAWDRDARTAFEGSLAALRGDVCTAWAILDPEEASDANPN